jgi:hypothetical protein
MSDVCPACNLSLCVLGCVFVSRLPGGLREGSSVWIIQGIVIDTLHTRFALFARDTKRKGPLTLFVRM